MTDEPDTTSEQDRPTTSLPVDPTPGSQLGCRPSLEELFHYMDGALDDDRRATMRSHLDACRGCGELYHVQAGYRPICPSGSSRPSPIWTDRAVPYEGGPGGTRTLSAMMTGVVWHWWLGLFLAIGGVLGVVGLVVGYLVKVQNPRYPRRP